MTMASASFSSSSSSSSMSSDTRTDGHDATLAPSQLGDRELAVLETTLRVQLQVSKCVRAAQVSSAVGAAALSGPLAAIPSGVSIATSQVQRSKLKRRHREVLQEVATRGLAVAVGGADAVRLGKRAYAMSVATGLACCLLAFSADVLIDCAVVKVVSDMATGYTDELAMGALAGHVTASLTMPTATNPTGNQQLKSKTRSWGGFASKWKTARLHTKAESLPPDLFGERDEAPPAKSPRQHVDIERSSEFGLFGECLVLRFPTIVPGDDGLDELGDLEDVMFGRERRDALSETQWRALWTLEDGPVDLDDLDEDDDDFDLFGTDQESYDLFGTGVQRVDTDTDYDLFGVTVVEEPHQSEAFQLFGLHLPPTQVTRYS